MKKIFLILFNITLFLNSSAQNDTLLSTEVQLNSTPTGRMYFSQLIDTSAFTGHIVKYWDLLDVGNKKKALMWVQKLDKGKVIEIKHFHKNGTIANFTECNFKGEIPNGTYKEWYETGELKLEGKYKEGNKSGIWITFFKNGQKETQEVYENDILVGEVKKWDETGKPK